MTVVTTTENKRTHDELYRDTPRGEDYSLELRFAPLWRRFMPVSWETILQRGTCSYFAGRFKGHNMLKVNQVAT